MYYTFPKWSITLLPLVVVSLFRTGSIQSCYKWIIDKAGVESASDWFSNKAFRLRFAINNESSSNYKSIEKSDYEKSHTTIKLISTDSLNDA